MIADQFLSFESNLFGIGKPFAVIVYDDIEIKSTKYCTRFLIFGHIATSGVFVMPFLRPAIHMITGVYSPESWYLPYKAQ